MKRTERGSTLPFIMLGMGTAVGAMLVISYVAAALIHASWAQTAADAAALAGASNGQVGAQQAAQANHGKIILFKTEGNDTVVQVKVDNVTKSARARHQGPSYALR